MKIKDLGWYIIALAMPGSVTRDLTQYPLYRCTGHAEGHRLYRPAVHLDNGHVYFACPAGGGGIHSVMGRFGVRRIFSIMTILRALLSPPVLIPSVNLSSILISEPTGRNHHETIQ